MAFFILLHDTTCKIGHRYVKVHLLFLQYLLKNGTGIVSSRVGTPPSFLLPPLSQANLKSYPLFLRAIQIGACKL